MSNDAQARDPRVFLALERTFLAWTRTALAMMGFGFVVARIGLFFRELAVSPPGTATTVSLRPSADGRGSLILGCSLIVMGVAVQMAALLQHRQRVRRFHAAEPIAPMRDAFATVVGLCILAAGLAGATYLLLRITN